jgi:hypothetical protein
VVAATEAAQAVDLRRGVPVGLVAAIAIGVVMAAAIGVAPGVLDDQDRTHPRPATLTRPPGRPSHLGLDLRRLTEISHGKTPVQYNFGFPVDVSG